MAAALLLGICFASIGCVGEGLSSILTDRSIPPDPNDRDGQGSNQPPDAAPFNFSATLGDALVLLAWTQKDGLNYDAYFSEMTGVTTETGTKLENITSPYTHRDLTNGTTYYYILVARNDAGVGPPTGEQSATPMANAAPPAPPVLPCSTIDGKLTVCVEVSRRMITEIQFDQPVTEVTLRTSDPIEGDRDSVNVFMRGVDVPMMTGMGGLPGTATLGEDYTVVVTEPTAGYAFPIYDDGFDEYTFSLSKLRPMIAFEIRANDDDAAPPMMGTNPRNENTDENITIEITGVVGSTRSGDTKVQNAILDPDLTGGTIMITTGQNPSLYSLKAFPRFDAACNANNNNKRFYFVGGANLTTTIARTNDPGASPAGTRNCTTVDFRVCQNTAGGCDANDELTYDRYQSIPTAVDPSGRFYMWTGGNSVGLSNFGTIQQFRAYDRFGDLTLEKNMPTGRGLSGGTGNVTGDMAIDSTGRMWLSIVTSTTGNSPQVMGLKPQTEGSIINFPNNTNQSFFGNSQVACRYISPLPTQIASIEAYYASIAINPYVADSTLYRVLPVRSAQMVGTLSLTPNDAIIRSYEDSCTGGFGSMAANHPMPETQSTTVLENYPTTSGRAAMKVDRRGLVYTLANKTSSRHGFSVWARVDAAGRLDPTGAGLAEVVRVGAAKGRNDNQFASPSAISFDSQHRIYVADTLNDRVMIYDACQTDMSNCCDSAVNSTACSMTGDSTRPALLAKIDGTKVLNLTTRQFDNVPGNRQLGTPGALVYPNGLSVDKDNYIWVVSVSHVEDRSTGATAMRVQVFAPYRPPN